jgi:hypothetical protein
MRESLFQVIYPPISYNFVSPNLVGNLANSDDMPRIPHIKIHNAVEPQFGIRQNGAGLCAIPEQEKRSA